LRFYAFLPLFLASKWREREKWRSSVQKKAARFLGVYVCVSGDRYQGFWQFGSRPPLQSVGRSPRRRSSAAASASASASVDVAATAPFSSWTVLRCFFCVYSLLLFLQIAAPRSARSRALKKKITKYSEKKFTNRSANAGRLRCQRRRTFRAALLTYFLANLALVTILL